MTTYSNKSFKNENGKNVHTYARKENGQITIGIIGESSMSENIITPLEFEKLYQCMTAIRNSM